MRDADRLSDWPSAQVVVAGLGVSGFAAADGLMSLGAKVIVLDESQAHADKATLLEALALLADGCLRAEAQDDSLATHAPKLRREQAVLDWSQPAAVLARRVRAFNPANVCQTMAGGEVLRIWLADAVATATTARPGEIVTAARDGIVVACGEGALRLTRLQLAGGRPMDAAALLNGHAARFRPGTVLGCAAGS